MKKKEYIDPTMKVVKLQQRCQLLSDSGGSGVTSAGLGNDNLSGGSGSGNIWSGAF